MKQRHENHHMTDETTFNVFDTDKLSYNIGDLLNMPYFCANWNNTPHADEYYYNHYLRTASQYRDNILGIYDTTRTDPNEPIPNVDRINSSTDIYIENNKNLDINLQHILDLAQDDTILFVHVRSGDRGTISEYFINIVNSLCEHYSKIVILCGIHKVNENIRKYYPSVEESTKILRDNLKKITNDKIIIDTNTPDIHLCAMHTAKNLLVHRYGFSMLGALLFTGNNLYISSDFGCHRNPDGTLRNDDDRDIVKYIKTHVKISYL